MNAPFESEDEDFRSPIGKLLRPQTKGEIRRSGLAGLVGGAALLVPGLLLMKLAPFLFSKALRKVTGFVIMAPYVILMTGLYRLVTGQRSEDAKRGFFWSLLRITLAVAFLVVSIAALLLLVAWVNRED